MASSAVRIGNEEGMGVQVLSFSENKARILRKHHATHLPCAGKPPGTLIFQGRNGRSGLGRLRMAPGQPDL
jgi:hypothetical protein